MINPAGSIFSKAKVLQCKSPEPYRKQLEQIVYEETRRRTKDVYGSHSHHKWDPSNSTICKAAATRQTSKTSIGKARAPDCPSAWTQRLGVRDAVAHDE
jgi:hypothetical protein